MALRADLGTLPDNGHTLSLEPIGLTVLTPGPVFILGGEGELPRSRSLEVESYVAVDIASRSIALGLETELKFPPRGDPVLVEGSGAVNGFFSFVDTSAWYLNIWTRETRSP